MTKTTVASAEPNDVDSFLSAMEQSRSYIASTNIIKEIARLARLGAQVEAMPEGTWLQHEPIEIKHLGKTSWRYHYNRNQMDCCNHGNSPAEALDIER